MSSENCPLAPKGKITFLFVSSFSGDDLRQDFVGIAIVVVAVVLIVSSSAGFFVVPKVSLDSDITDTLELDCDVTDTFELDCDVTDPVEFDCDVPCPVIFDGTMLERNEARPLKSNEELSRLEVFKLVEVLRKGCFPEMGDS